MELTLTDRAMRYNLKHTKWPDSFLHVENRMICGVWMTGSFYKNKSTLYGAYPHNYVARISTLFPDARNVLHLFGGSLTTEDVQPHMPDAMHWFFDINYEDNNGVYRKGDAHELSKHVGEKPKFDLVMADPPYSGEDAEHYGTPMINRNVVVKECVKVIKPGGFLVWLDQVYPMYRKDEWSLDGLIGFVRSTNHRFRVIVILRRV